MNNEKLMRLVNKIAYEIEIKGVTLDDFNKTIEKLKKVGFKVTKVGKDSYRIYYSKLDGWSIWKKVQDTTDVSKFVPGVFSKYCSLSFPNSVNEKYKSIVK